MIRVSETSHLQSRSTELYACCHQTTGPSLTPVPGLRAQNSEYLAYVETRSPMRTSTAVAAGVSDGTKALRVIERERRAPSVPGCGCASPGLVLAWGSGSSDAGC